MRWDGITDSVLLRGWDFEVLYLLHSHNILVGSHDMVSPESAPGNLGLGAL